MWIRDIVAGEKEAEEPCQNIENWRRDRDYCLVFVLYSILSIIPYDTFIEASVSVPCDDSFVTIQPIFNVLCIFNIHVKTATLNNTAIFELLHTLKYGILNPKPQYGKSHLPHSDGLNK